MMSSGHELGPLDSILLMVWCCHCFIRLSIPSSDPHSEPGMPGSGVNVSLQQMKKLKVKAAAEALLPTPRQATISLLPHF